MVTCIDSSIQNEIVCNIRNNFSNLNCERANFEQSGFWMNWFSFLNHLTHSSPLLNRHQTNNLAIAREISENDQLMIYLTLPNWNVTIVLMKKMRQRAHLKTNFFVYLLLDWRFTSPRCVFCSWNFLRARCKKSNETKTLLKTEAIASCAPVSSNWTQGIMALIER